VAGTNSVRAARRLSGTIGYAADAWSPDGTRIALAGGTHMTNPIRVENADGTGLHAVSRPRLATEDDAGAAWSPDGTAIAFSRYVFYGKHTDYNRFGVWIVDVRTRHERRLTREYAGALAWSPTGDVIAADLGEDLDAKIALVRPDGAVVRTFTVPGQGLQCRSQLVAGRHATRSRRRCDRRSGGDDRRAVRASVDGRTGVGLP